MVWMNGLFPVAQDIVAFLEQALAPPSLTVEFTDYAWGNKGRSYKMAQALFECLLKTDEMIRHISDKDYEALNNMANHMGETANRLRGMQWSTGYILP